MVSVEDLTFMDDADIEGVGLTAGQVQRLRATIAGAPAAAGGGVPTTAEQEITTTMPAWVAENLDAVGQTTEVATLSL